jgi:signal transduction histidine kinase
MNPNWRSRLLLGAPGLALVAGVLAVLLEGPNADRVLNATFAGVGLVLVWSVAVAVRLRYPDRPLGPLLFVLAGAYAVQTLLASPNPYLFTLARAARPAVEVLLIWIMLAFPSGRLLGRSERLLVAASALAVLLLWLPGLMLSPSMVLAGPFVQCAPACPRNVLFVADWPALSQAFNAAFRVVGACILVTTGGVLFLRLRRATPLLRRALAPVLLASIARTLALAAFLITDANLLVLPLTFWAVPLAIALGLLRGRLYAARALQALVSGLRGRPDAHELRNVMARALGDETLSIAYWLKDRERWVDADGRVVALPYPSSEHGRAATLARDAEGRPVAALVHDTALLEEPTLIEAIASSMQMALESQRMDAEIRASGTRSASAVEAERHRIERDLHDGAQQRLIALRMKLSVTARLLEHDPRRADALVQEMGADVEAALVELRALAHGIAPPLLVERGLCAALTEAAQRAALPTGIEIEDVGRCDPGIERAVYFCCLEALQNVAKHAGPRARVQLNLLRVNQNLRFSVADDGSAPANAGPAPDGQGLANMRERIRSVGGQLEIQRLPGKGFRVAGEVPAPNLQPAGLVGGH